jgi:hypothetical protein
MFARGLGRGEAAYEGFHYTRIRAILWPCAALVPLLCRPLPRGEHFALFPPHSGQFNSSMVDINLYWNMAGLRWNKVGQASSRSSLGQRQGHTKREEAGPKMAARCGDNRTEEQSYACTFPVCAFSSGRGECGVDYWTSKTRGRSLSGRLLVDPF